MLVLHMFWICHKQNMLPIGTIWDIISLPIPTYELQAVSFKIIKCWKNFIKNSMAFDVVKIGGFDIYSEFLHNHVFGKVIEGTYNCKKILSLSFAESWICEKFFSVKFSLLSLSLSLSLTHSLLNGFKFSKKSSNVKITFWSIPTNPAARFTAKVELFFKGDGCWNFEHL